MKPKPKVGVVYHYLAHYRLPIFKELMNSEINIYTIISDNITTDGIKGVDAKLANKSIDNGGLRWLFVKNKWYKNKFLWQKGLIKLLRKEKYDKVIFLGNVYYISTWFAIFYLKIQNTKIVFWTHGVTSNENGLKWKIRKAFYNLADLVMLYGHNAKNVMINNGFPEKKLTVIYNSLDYEMQIVYRSRITKEVIQSTKNQLFSNPELPYLVFVGRLTSQKKLEMLLEAVKLCFHNSLPLNTLFVGKGESQASLEKLVQANKMQNHVRFYGPCYDEEELSKLIGAADLCVSPGEVGLTAMTSLGYGTPVLSHGDFNHQMPEYEAIIPGFNGELFERDSVEDLARKIQSWLNYVAKIPREKIQENCFSVIDEKYNPIKQVKIIDAEI